MSSYSECLLEASKILKQASSDLRQMQEAKTTVDLLKSAGVIADENLNTQLEKFSSMSEDTQKIVRDTIMEMKPNNSGEVSMYRNSYKDDQANRKYASSVRSSSEKAEAIANYRKELWNI